MSDLVTFGETMLRYSPPSGERFENADSFTVHVGGAESNVAVAGARLGCETRWLSKLPDNPLGRRIVATLRSHGVSTDVVWSDDSRVGVYYVEPGGEPRGQNVLYDREEAAVATATPAELATGHVESADVFYTSGIAAAVSETLAETTQTLLQTAASAGTTTAFDVNYRSKLWSPASARETLDELLPAVDILVVAERDAATVFEETGSPEAIGREFRAEYGHEMVVVTRGVRGALAVTGDGVYEQPTFEADTQDPVGSGDAFVGGFLACWLEDQDVESALEYGAATAAVKRTLEGDMAVVSPREVEAVVQDDDSRSR